MDIYFWRMGFSSSQVNKAGFSAVTTLTATATRLMLILRLRISTDPVTPTNIDRKRQE